MEIDGLTKIFSPEQLHSLCFLNRPPYSNKTKTCLFSILYVCDELVYPSWYFWNLAFVLQVMCFVCKEECSKTEQENISEVWALVVNQDSVYPNKRKDD